MESSKEIQNKLNHLRTYVPFVQRMITKLEARTQVAGKGQNQLDRLRGLLKFLTSPTTKLPRMEMLEKMEAVIRSMQEKVQKAQEKPAVGHTSSPGGALVQRSEAGQARGTTHGTQPSQNPAPGRISTITKQGLGPENVADQRRRNSSEDNSNIGKKTNQGHISESAYRSISGVRSLTSQGSARDHGSESRRGSIQDYKTGTGHGGSNLSRSGSLQDANSKHGTVLESQSNSILRPGAGSEKAFNHGSSLGSRLGPLVNPTSSSSKSQSVDWQATKGASGGSSIKEREKVKEAILNERHKEGSNAEKRDVPPIDKRERGGEVVRESSFERNRIKDFDRSQGRHFERSRDRESDKRDRDKERSRPKDFERRRDHDFNRSRENERVDGRSRVLLDSQYDRSRERKESSRDRERERSREAKGGHVSREREYDHSKERDYQRLHRHSSLSEDRRQEDLSQSKQRNSLLDLPMPPTSSSHNLPYPYGGVKNVAEPNSEKFKTSREKLQKLFGIFDDTSSGGTAGHSGIRKSTPGVKIPPSPSEPDVIPSSQAAPELRLPLQGSGGGGGWRDEFRARKDTFFAHKGISSDGKFEVQHHKPKSTLHDESNSRNSHHPIPAREHIQDRNVIRHSEPRHSEPRHSEPHNWRLDNPNSNLLQHSNFVQASHSRENLPPPDSPMSLESHGFDTMDTPQSPDLDASFSPVTPSEDSVSAPVTPVKTIPLDKIKDKEVDLEQIKKALAQIHSKKQSEMSSSSSQVPSYRYEDFVGPATKTPPVSTDDDPYDPEEVWNSPQNMERVRSVVPATSIAPPPPSVSTSHKDIDLRQIPRSLLPITHGLQARPQEKPPQLDPQAVHRNVSNIPDSVKSMPSSVADIPLPPRQPPPPKPPDIPIMNTSGVQGSGWYQGTPTSKPSDPRSKREEITDVDMRLAHHQPPLSKYQIPPLPKSPHPSVSKSQSTLSSSNTSQLQASSSSQSNSAIQNSEDMSEKDSHKMASNRLDSIRSRIAQGATELIKPGQRGVAATQLENYRLKRQVSTSSTKERQSGKRESTGSGEPVSVLDLLLPEEKKDEKPESGENMRQGMQDSSTLPLRDPRLKSQESLSSKSVRDPRLPVSTHSGRKPISAENNPPRDPRQESGKFSGLSIRDSRDDQGKPAAGLLDKREVGKTPVRSGSQLNDPRRDSDQFSSVHGMGNRDPRQESRKFMETPRSLPRDPRQDVGSLSRDPRQDTGSLTRDPRQDVGSLSRDPRQDAGSLSRDPRQDTGSLTRDPRQDAGSLSRDPRQDNRPGVRDPRQDVGPVPRDHRQDVRLPSRDPRQDCPPSVRDSRIDVVPSLRNSCQDSGMINRDIRPEMNQFSGMLGPGKRDPRQETGMYAASSGSQFRDPRMLAKNERPLGNMWQPQQSQILSGSYPVASQAPRSYSVATPAPGNYPVATSAPGNYPVATSAPGNYPVATSAPSIPMAVDPDPTQSASCSLIGKSFTCLMMRGLPPFTNSNHIYLFFQEYILRDMSLELDNHYNCKGTAYIHFPSHNSAREAMELLNGKHLQGYPVTLRICTVGILRQAKNAYEQMNRDREARLGIQEKPRGNGNPFFKPRPPEPLVKPPPPRVEVNPPNSVMETSTSRKASQEANDEEGAVSGNAKHYSELCGVRMPPKDASGKSSFKIPKIKKQSENNTIQGEVKSKGNKSPKTSTVTKGTDSRDTAISKGVSRISSDSDDDIFDLKQVNRKNKKYKKKIVIQSDSESEIDEKVDDENDADNKSTKSPALAKDESESSDDEGTMVIDETALSDTESEESEVSSVVSDDFEQIPAAKTRGKKKKTQPKRGKVNRTQKNKRNETVAPKKKTKTQVNRVPRVKKTRAKKHIDKYMVDNVYKPELDLHSTVGLKLTRHTQGELEELIPKKNSLKVMIPTPLKYVTLLFDEEKLKRRVGRQKATEVVYLPDSSVSSNLSAADDTSSVDAGDTDLNEPVVTVTSKKKRGKQQRTPPVSKAIVKKRGKAKGKKVAANQGKFVLINRYLNAKNVKKRVYWTPTQKRGQKRKIPITSGDDKRKKVKSSSVKEIPKVHDVSSEGTELDASGKKRSLPTPPKGNAVKKLRSNMEDSPMSKQDSSSSHVFEDCHSAMNTSDIFDNDSSSDDLPDLTQITPSLLDVDPTICNALPDASALATVLSPPHISSQGGDTLFSSDDVANNTVPSDITPQESSDSVNKVQREEALAAQDDTKLENQKLDEKSGEQNGKEVKQMEQPIKEKEKEDTHVASLKSVSHDSLTVEENVGEPKEHTEAAEAKSGAESSEKLNIPKTVGLTEKTVEISETIESTDSQVDKPADTEDVSIEEPKGNQIVDENSVEKKKDSDVQLTQVPDNNDEQVKMPIPDESLSTTKTQKQDVLNDSKRQEEQSLKEKDEVKKDSLSNETKASAANDNDFRSTEKEVDEKKLKESDPDVHSKLQPFIDIGAKGNASKLIVEQDEANKHLGLKDGNKGSKLALDSLNSGVASTNTDDTEEMDDGDDSVSVGMVSTGSFVDDSSVVSSEGRDQKTPDPAVPKKGKRAKLSLASHQPEIRRVTRGSLVEPLITEVVEWDDGGAVDLFQCDMCDYVGRHIASHLVNFHSEREVPCEFKKEDFPPVIKDHVGPPALYNCEENLKFSLGWIPPNMTFEKSVTCKNCDYFSNSRFDLIYHYLEHYPKAAQNVFHCRLCNYMSEQKECFYNHMSSHTGEYRYKCDHCGYCAYKLSLLQAHHNDSHRTQPQKFSIAEMLEEDGWPYIHVCKTCMFVRISSSNVEVHIQQRHGGKGDVHKANMTRHVVLYSELRKGGDGDSVPTTRSVKQVKGKKKKKGGKKGPNLEVFGGEEDSKEVEEEVEEKAKQLVDSISMKIHTTTSAELAQKRMSLLNSISRKLDEEEEEEMEEEETEAGISKDLSKAVKPTTDSSRKGNKITDEKEENKSHNAKTPDKLPLGKGCTRESDMNGVKQSNDESKESKETTKEVMPASDPTIGSDSNELKRAAARTGRTSSDPGDNASEQYPHGAEDSSDGESTLSALEPLCVDYDDEVEVGKGFLQETIRKLSAKLEDDAKQKSVKEVHKVPSPAPLPQPPPEVCETPAAVPGNDVQDNPDDDSDSDALVICEDDETDVKDEKVYPAASETKVDQNIRLQKREMHDALPIGAHSVPHQLAEKEKIPKLRVRPAHQLMEPRYSPKKPALRFFKCSVALCKYSSSNNRDLIEHIIRQHGPYKCIAMGCQFVTRSREQFSLHVRGSHAKLSLLVCPFHCTNVFYEYEELFEHLSQHSLDSDPAKTDGEDIQDSDEPGFLRIESVGTLDPTSASQMFGDDCDDKPSVDSQSPGQLASPSGVTVTCAQGVSFTLPNSSPGKIINPALNTHMGSLQAPARGQVLLPEGVTDGAGYSKSEAHSVSGLVIPLQQPGSSVSRNTVIPVKLYGTSESNVNPPVTNVSSTSAPHSVAPQICEANKTYTTVMLDNVSRTGGTQSDSDQPEPPGVAYLPKIPPTVPIQSVFLAYQPADIFKTLTTKLAPEIFKCMFTGCLFGDDDPDAFTQHLSQHNDNFRCCYCLMMMTTPDGLVRHIITEHSHCQFQCKYCLYRAFTKIYMGVHLKNFHPYDEPRYIKVGTIQTHHPPNPPIDQFVRPYKCSHQDCQFRTVDAEAFKSHVNTHGPFVVLSCDFCHKHLHVKPLIEHMREHQMNEYQCPYCLHGDAEKERLLSHLLNCHPGRPGKVLLRKQITTPSIGASVSTPLGTSSSGSSPLHSSQPANNPSKTARAKSPAPDTSQMLGGESQLVLDKVLPEKGEVSTTSITGKEVLAPPAEGRRISRSMSREIDSKIQESRKSFSSSEEEVNASSQISAIAGEESSASPVAEKTGLSGSNLYRCGNEGCEYSSVTSTLLREHLQVCEFTRDSTVLKCYHCGKQCRHLSTLFDHLRVHGPKKYKCGVVGCDYRATMVHYFKNHMKQIHRCSIFKQVIKDMKCKDPENQEYVVYPKDALPAAKEWHKKRKNEYGVEDLHRIPRPHISYHDLKCYYCQFVTKVRLNLIKHVKLHEKHPNGIPERLHISEGTLSPIPQNQPVNPVPCLDRKELMFDKMMNLAGSSFESKKKKEHSDLRTKHPIPTDELEKLPKFVPEERLHSCGIDGCNYCSCDDMMLKYHIRTLHANVTTFPCPHCIDYSITIEKINSHFKLHGDRLFRCGWCPYLSYRRNLVERHMKEKHPSKKPFDFVIREQEDPAAQTKSEEEKPEVEPAVPVAAPVVPQDPQWQCGLCNFNSVTQQEMVNHTSLKHAIKSQYKCGYCSVRSSVRTSFDAHFAAKHPNQPFRVLCMYYRLDSEDIEPIQQGSGQHSHEPLWKRNDPERIRHIRGILIDHDPETKKSWLKKTGLGKPDKGEFVCPRCSSFKTACMSTFHSHLCREADYDRYQCVTCGVTNALLPSLQRHYTKMHHAVFTAECYINLPVEEEKEAWVTRIVNHQEALIKQWQEKGGLEASAAGCLSPSLPQQSSPARAAASSRRSSTSSLTSEGPPQQGGIVLHDSGSERGRFTCETCGSECRSAAGLKSHTTAMHQARFKCHYCPFASNTESAVKQHSSTKHPKLQNEIKIQKDDDGLITEASGENGESRLLPKKTDPYYNRNNDDQMESENEGPLERSTEMSHMSESLIDYEATEIKSESEELIEEISPDTVPKYSCSYCPYRTHTTSNLNYHNRSKHPDTRLFVCMHCNNHFNTHKDAMCHHKWKHQMLKPNITYLLDEASRQEKSEKEFEAESTESSNRLSRTVSSDSESLRQSDCAQNKPRNSGVPSASTSTTVGRGRESLYTCCHCSQKSNRTVMEEHMKKQHRDLPYQVRREEGDKIFTEVHVYKCIHCVAESISLAQAMDHWIQNHALQDFKYNLVLRHSGEVSNQVVSSTTVDRDPSQESNKRNVDADAATSVLEVPTRVLDMNVSDRGARDVSPAKPSSCSVITSTSESKFSKVSKASKQKLVERPIGSSKDASSARSSIDMEEGDLEMDILDESFSKDPQETGDAGMMYKCGVCKKSSEQLQVIEDHMSMVHPDKKTAQVKKIPRKKFDQLYRDEYQCDYCSESGRNGPISRHHKAAHPNQPLSITRIAAPMKKNTCFRCDVCGHVVKRLVSIRQHIRRHHPEAEDKNFSKLSLGSPMRPPSKQPYKYCDKRWINKGKFLKD